MVTFSQSRHGEIVRAENERRRLAKEEADRLAYEKAERRRLKLEMKLRRRENRRLVALENIFTEVYAATADIEKDIINLADLDGSDNNGMKSMGLRGGFIGEVYFQLQQLRKFAQFEAVGVDWPQYPAFMSAFWQSMVGEGWTIFLGQDPLFEKNIIPVMEGANLDRLDTEFLRSLSGQDTSGLLTYLKAHYRNSFLDSRYPGLVERRSKLMDLLKYEPPTDDQPADKDTPDDNADNADLERDLNQVPLPSPEDDPEATPEQIDLLKYLDSIFNLILDEGADLYGVRFVKFQPKVQEEKKDDDGGEPVAPTPKVTAVFIPVPPPPVVEGDPIQDPSGLKASDSKIAAPQPAAPVTTPDGDGGDGDGDGDADQKPAPEPEVLPFVPEDDNFVGDFEAQVSLVDYAKKELDVACYHVPLVKAIATKMIAAAAQQLQVEGDLSEFIGEIVLSAIRDVREFSKENGRDVLYINSY